MAFYADLHGKVALITGATSMNGRHGAIEFAKRGCRVALVGKVRRELAETARLCISASRNSENILQIFADLEDTEECQRALDETVETFGQLDMLVNSHCGDSFKGTLKDLPLEEYEMQMKGRVNSTFVIIQAAVPYLRDTSGSIVNLSSLRGSKPAAGKLADSVSKAALDRMTQAISLELAGDGVRVISVSPEVIGHGIQKWMSLEDESGTNPLINLGTASFPISMQEFFCPLSEEAVVLKLLSVVPKLYSHAATLLNYKL